MDTLLRFDSEDDGSLLLAVEAQRERDPDKPASWSYYLSFLSTKYKLPVLLLVVCQDPATAEWAARPASLGPAQWPALTLCPLVAGPHNMPVITDPNQASADLALATLSAITHAKNPVVNGILKALSTALQDVPEAVADPLIELATQGLDSAPRALELWRTLVAVDLSFYKSSISEEIRDEGRDEGRIQRGAEDILVVLQARGIHVPDDIRARITGCNDPDLLRRWLIRATVAPTAEEILTDDDA